MGMTDKARLLRERVDARDELSALIKRVCDDPNIIKYDTGDWDRMAEALIDSELLRKHYFKHPDPPESVFTDITCPRCSEDMPEYPNKSVKMKWSGVECVVCGWTDCY